MTTKKKIRRPREPQLRLHKASGRTFATFSNPTNVDPDTGSIESWKVWFGPKSRDAERRFLAYRARWDLADYRRPDEDAPAGGFTVRDLVNRYRAHVLERRGADWFERNGCRFEASFVPLLAIEGTATVASIGAKKVGDVRRAMLAEGKLCREELNARIGIIKAAFRWAAEEELAPASVWHSVSAIKGLETGAYGVREGKGRREPVTDDVIEATLPHMSAKHADRLRLLRLVGARPSELYGLTPSMIERDGDVWTADIVEHKTKKHGLDRMLAFGPKAQAILRPLLLRCGTGGLMFREPDVDAREAVQALTKEIGRAVKRANVERAVDGLQRLARREGDAAARRLLRDRYRVLHFAKWTADDGITRTRLGTVAELVQRVGSKRIADLVRDVGGEPVPNWTAYQLRHTRLSEVRREFGLEGSAAIGGHSLGKEARITEGYTGTAQRELACMIALKTG